MTHLNFTFPLNLYAHLLYLDTGTHQALHFGLFEDDTLDIVRAQNRASKRFLDQMPPAPARVLEVGIGLGQTCETLLELGYDYTGITPDKAQIELLKRKQPGAKLLCTPFQSHPFEANSYDVLLFQESSQYIDALDLFSNACRLLAPNGRILMMDEFATALPCGPSPLHGLDAFKSLASRLGFACVRELNFTGKVSPTLDYALKSIQRHRNALQHDLQLDAETLRAFEADVARQKQCHEDGRYGYYLLSLKLNDRPRYLLANANADAAGCHRLFETVFNAPMKPAFWDWKYRHSRAASVALVDAEGTTVGHYGGMSRDILYFGIPKRAIQPCDTMIHPSARGGTGTKSRLYRMARTFLERAVGPGKPFFMAYGFPNRRVMRTAELLNLYHEVDRLVELRYSLSSDACDATEAFELSDDHAPQVNALWSAMRADFADRIIGVRDWAYLRYRYRTHPTLSYRLFGLKDANRDLRIVLVLKQEHNQVRLMDLLCREKDYTPALLAAQQLAASNFSVNLLTFWITKSQVHYFQASNPELFDPNVSIPTDAFLPTPPAPEIEHRWWLTYGDTDFI